MNSPRSIVPRKAISIKLENDRPQKRQKSGADNLMNVVLVLADIGTTKFNHSDYSTAEECFSQALCQVDIDYIYSQVHDMKAKNNGKATRKPAKIHTENSSSTKNKIENSLPADVQSSDKFESHQLSQEEEPLTQQKIEYDEGMRVYRDLLQIRESTPIDETAANLYYNIAQTYVQRELYSDAIIWFHKSLDKFLSLYTNNNKDSLLPIVMNLHSLGYCHYRLGRDHLAKEFYQRAFDFLSINGLGKAHLAATINCIGVIIFNQQQTCDSDQAMNMFLESLELYKSCDQIESTGNLVATIATVMNNIGRVYYLRSDFKNALKVYKECVKLRRESLDEYSVDVAATAYNLGQTLYQLGHLDDALTYYHDFLTIMVLKVGSKSKDIALVYKGIAEIHQDKANPKTALHYFERALEIQKAHTKPGIANAEIATLLNKMGNQCYAMKDFHAAMKYYRQGLQIEKAILEPNHPHIIITTTNIGHIYKQFGEYQNALVSYRQVYQMQLKQYGDDHFVLAETMSSIGLMQYQLKSYEASFDSYQEALRIRRQHFGIENDEHPEIASTLNSIGLVLFRQEIYDLAKHCFTESLRIRTKLLGKDHREVAILWYNIATIHFETGEDELAIQMYKETLRVERQALGHDHPDVILTLQHLGQVHQQLGHTEKALQYFREALTVERQRKESSERSMARILNLLGNAYLQIGKTSEMMECYVEASRLYGAIHRSQSPPNASSSETLVIGGYNFYGLSKTNPPCAPVA